MHPSFGAFRVADAAPEFEFAHNFHRQFAALIGPFNRKAGARAASHIHLIGAECRKARQRQAGDGPGSGRTFRRRGRGRRSGFRWSRGTSGGGGPRSGSGGDTCCGPGGSAIALALSCLGLACGPLRLGGRALLLLLSGRALLLLRCGALLALRIALGRLRPGRRIDYRWPRFRTLGLGRRPSWCGRLSGLARRRHILRAPQA